MIIHDPVWFKVPTNGLVLLSPAFISIQNGTLLCYEACDKECFELLKTEYLAHMVQGFHRIDIQMCLVAAATDLVLAASGFVSLG